MAGNGRRTRGRQMLALGLARGLTVRDAAKEAGISERQAFRRLSDQTFQSEVRRLRDDIVHRTCSMLSEAGLAAVTTLKILMQEAPTDAVRLSAAKSVLDLGLRLREADGVLSRIEKLEE